MADTGLELSKGVSLILPELEINATEDNSGNNDVAVSIRTSFGQIARALIRPINPRGNFQLVFCFG